MKHVNCRNTGDTVISIRNLSVSYGSKRVLEGIDLDVYRGEILVLLGGSGSGEDHVTKTPPGFILPSYRKE